MTTRPDASLPARAGLSEQDLIIAELFDRYIQQRERGESLDAADLLAAASEHGAVAADVLAVLIACYEATRARDDADRGPPGMPQPLARLPGLSVEADAGSSMSERIRSSSNFGRFALVRLSEARFAGSIPLRPASWE
jgi:hypothetical protein